MDSEKRKAQKKAHMKTYAPVYYEKNKDLIKAYKKVYMKAYYAKNKESITRKNREWEEKNREKVNETARRRYGRSAGQILRKIRKMSALPKWADASAIRAVYAEAALGGLHVDHIVPLVSKTVCGLHCEQNLRPLSAYENLRKSNRFWPDMW